MKKIILKKIQKLTAVPSRIFRLLLFYYFRFDHWHIIPLQNRKYANDIIQHLNARANRNSIVEIGCGLGDIVSHLNYASRVGYDIEDNALKAARFLSRISGNGDVQFSLFKFPESSFNEQVDVIIMVNWIHHISPAILRNKIAEYFKNHLTERGEIIIDTVQHDEYEYNHSVDFLISGLACKVQKIGDDIRQREIFAIQKK